MTEQKTGLLYNLQVFNPYIANSFIKIRHDGISYLAPVTFHLLNNNPPAKVSACHRSSSFINLTLGEIYARLVQRKARSPAFTGEKVTDLPFSGIFKSALYTLAKFSVVILSKDETLL